MNSAPGQLELWPCPRCSALYELEPTTHQTRQPFAGRTAVLRFRPPGRLEVSRCLGCDAPLAALYQSTYHRRSTP